MHRSFSIVALVLLLLLTPAFAAKRHHRPKHRPQVSKFFPAIPKVSVLLENQTADEMGAERFDNERDMQDAIVRGDLVAIVPNQYLAVSKKLPVNRWFARPVAVSFIQNLSLDFTVEFGVPLVVDSAVRPATVQKKLIRHNRCAAPWTGDRASTHERGTTIDISRNLTKAEYRWLVYQLLYYRAIGVVLVIEEKACFHIFVRGYGTVSLEEL
jgi:hypothetical protein